MDFDSLLGSFGESRVDDEGVVGLEVDGLFPMVDGGMGFYAGDVLGT